MFYNPDFIPASARGEKCPCGRLAARKVAEVIFDDDPFPNRHPATAYLCFECFENIMGKPLTLEDINKATKLVAAGQSLKDLTQGLIGQGMAYVEEDDKGWRTRQSPIVVGDEVTYISRSGRRWKAEVTGIPERPWHQRSPLPTVHLKFRNERGKLVHQKCVLPYDVSYTKSCCYIPKEKKDGAPEEAGPVL